MTRRKDGRWVKNVTINGKRIFFYSSAKTERQAEKDISQQMIAYNEADKKGKLFSVIADEWEENHFDTLEHYTARRYKTLLNHALDFFSNHYIKSITAEQIEQFLQFFANKKYSTKTIKDQFSIIKMIFRYAYINGYVSSDPTQYIKPPKGVASVHREAITEEQMKIVEKSTECTFGLLAYFLMYTGLRKGELLALQWKDIDFTKKEIYITKSVCHHDNKPHIKTPKTKSGTRTVMLLDCLSEKLKIIKDRNPEHYIFSESDTPLTNSQFQCRWEKYQKETGLDITAHQLRHTFATILFEADINVKDAQNIMGHSDISVTQNIYTHIRKQRMSDTASKLNNYGRCGKSCVNSIKTDLLCENYGRNNFYQGGFST